MYCSFCGSFLHDEDNCPKKKEKEQEPEPDDDEKIPEIAEVYKCHQKSGSC